MPSSVTMAQSALATFSANVVDIWPDLHPLFSTNMCQATMMSIPRPSSRGVLDPLNSRVGRKGVISEFRPHVSNLVSIRSRIAQCLATN